MSLRPCCGRSRTHSCDCQRLARLEAAHAETLAQELRTLEAMREQIASENTPPETRMRILLLSAPHARAEIRERLRPVLIRALIQASQILDSEIRLRIEEFTHL